MDAKGVRTNGILAGPVLGQIKEEIMTLPQSRSGGETFADGEARFKIGDQWYYRGNRSPSWFAVASRPDGSCQGGIADRIPQDYWPWLEVVAELKKQLAAPSETCSALPKTALQTAAPDT